MTIKRYTLTYDRDYTMILDVDTDHVLLEDYLHYYDVNLTQFLKILYLTYLRESVTSFEAEVRFNKLCIEGMPTLDGSEGFTLIEAEDFIFDDENVLIEVIGAE